jgi:hypothetical protein
MIKPTSSQLRRVRPGPLVSIALALLLAGCLSPRLAAKADPAVQAARRACASLPETERYPCIEQQAVQALEPEVCRLAGMAIDDACLQAVYEAAADPGICERLYLRGVRPTCRAYYAAAAASAVEAAGLSWRECLVRADVEEWRQAEACFGHPALAWDDADRAHAGERTAAGHRLTIGLDVYETRAITTPIPNLSVYALSVNGRLRRLFLGRFTTYSPDLGLADLAGRTAWTFDDGRLATILYDGVDLRAAYGFEAVYAPYAIRDRLIFVARQDDQYFVVYDGRRLGPVFDRILIAYCCEPAAYSARGASSRYTLWGERNRIRYMVEINAR